MSKEYNKIITYEFSVEAISPIYFGGSEQGKLLVDIEGPFIFGSAIGGALRNYLENCGTPKKILYQYLGGNESGNFIESKIYISDGKVLNFKKIHEKHGTKINSMSGSGDKHHKYTLECLQPGNILAFELECEIESKEQENQFESLIESIKNGFLKEQINLGGQISNGFGRFKLVKLQKAEYTFSNSQDIDEHIDRLKESLKLVKIEESNIEVEQKQLKFSLNGAFPYGVYQSFDVKKEGLALTGIQKRVNYYYIPASSLKGVIKSEVRLLLSRFENDENKISEKLDELFGDQKKKGKLIFYDIILENADVVTIEQGGEDGNHNNKEIEYSTYIKIDRLTGGTIEGAMKRQKEIHGEANLECILTDCTQKNNPYIFPIIYVLNRIGEGLVPLGGRTSIGLGEFCGTKLTLSNYINDVLPMRILTLQQEQQIQEYYNNFKGWCKG